MNLKNELFEIDRFIITEEKPLDYWQEKIKKFYTALEKYDLGDEDDEEYMNDSDYNELEKELLENRIIKDITWVEHLDKYRKFKYNEAEDSRSELKELKSKSIRPVRTAMEGFTFLKGFPPGTEFLFMDKDDGINGRVDENDGVVLSAITKGRSGNSFNVEGILNKSGAIGKLNKVTMGEFIVSNKDLEYINSVCGRYYKIPRSCTIGLIRGTCTYPELLKYRVFNVEGCKLLSEGLAEAKKAGYETVNYITVKNTEIQSVEDLRKYMQKIWDISEGITTDGMVIKVNDQELYHRLGGDDKYDEGSIAIKAEMWEAYSNVIATVSGFNIENIGLNGSCEILLEPVVIGGIEGVSNSGITLRRVNAYNIDTLHNRGDIIKIGDKIRINYKSGANSEFVCKVKEG